MTKLASNPSRFTRPLAAVIVGLALLSACSGDAAYVADGDDTESSSGALTTEEQAGVKATEASLATAANNGRPQLRVTPVLECVDKISNSTYVAHFGWDNTSSGTVTIPVGPLNRFFPAPKDRGQGTSFAKGRQKDKVKVTFSDPYVSWILDGRYAIAVKSSPRCPSPPPLCPDSCDDGNACTADVCNKSTGFKCAHKALSNGTSCSDKNVCNGAEVCQAGVCKPGKAVTCVDDKNPCTAERCDANLGCISANVADGTKCTLAANCGAAAQQCKAGKCVASTPKCDDSNPCTNDVCNSTGKCSHTNLSKGTSCQDMDVCNGAESCDGKGVCASSTPVACVDDGNACTIESCDVDVGCLSVPGNDGGVCKTSDGKAGVCGAGACFPPVICVDDGNPCTDEVVVGNVCTHPARANNSACNDGNACTQTDSCQAGLCVGANPVLCSVSDQCHQATCDTTTGACLAAAVADGTACNDGDACTGGDRCTAGVCTRGATPLCQPPKIVINEIESSGGVPGDWVELFNADTTAVDLSGWRFKDNDDTHNYVVPAGTVIAPGGYVTLEEAAIVFGLGAADSARLYDAGGTLVDQYAWTAHATTTYGRCPNGSGAFATTATVTKAAANDCGGGGTGGAGGGGGTGGAGGGGGTGGAGGAGGDVDGGAGGAGGGAGGGSDGGAVPLVVINEVESSGGVPGDWTELYNPGAAVVDASGWIFRDNDNTHTYVLPSGSVIAPGGYLVLEEASVVFGLGAADSTRLFDASGTVIIDTYSWTAHATTTYGRCPNGSGALTTTGSPTKGGPNDCSSGGTGGAGGGAGAGGAGGTGGVAGTGGGAGTGGAGGTGGISFSPWPGPDSVVTVDSSGQWGSNLSGLTYQAASGGNNAVLWAVQNSPSVLFRLEWNGTTWANSTQPGWGAGKTMVYASGTGGPDSEGVTLAELESPAIYVATERDNTVSTVSRLSVLRFDTSAAGTTLTATHEWNLTADLPTVGANLGLEAITWVPDSFLVGSGFIDESTGAPYNPESYSNHGTGLFFVGVEGTGMVYAYALDHGAPGVFHRIAAFSSGQAGVMGIEFDRELGNLWTYCDNTCGNKATIFAISTDPSNAKFGHFDLRAAFLRPPSMPDINNEGIAFAPLSECVGGLRSFWWSDDNATSGHSLRAGAISCGPLP